MFSRSGFPVSLFRLWYEALRFLREVGPGGGVDVEKKKHSSDCVFVMTRWFQTYFIFIPIIGRFLF